MKEKGDEVMEEEGYGVKDKDVESDGIETINTAKWLQFHNRSDLLFSSQRNFRFTAEDKTKIRAS